MACYYMLNSLSFTLLVYLYYRFLTHAHTNYELGFALKPSTMAHKFSNVTVNPDTDVYQEYYDKIVLTEEEEARVIREYSRREREIRVN